MNLKKLILLPAFLFFSLLLNAQLARFTLFTENGERFFAYLNGKLMNAGLQTSVTSKSIPVGGVEVRVVFDNEAYRQKSFNLLLHEGYEINFMLKRNKKGEFVIRFMGEQPITEEKSEEIVQYTTTTTTVQTQSENPQTSSSNSPVGLKINSRNGESSSTITTDVSYTVTSTNTYTQTPVSKPATAECVTPMSEDGFYNAKSSLDSKSFEDTKMAEAKQIINANCMTSFQIKELISTFSFEDSKLSFAKYAYKRCTDKQNYYVINDAFTFSSSTNSLTNYINSQK